MVAQGGTWSSEEEYMMGIDEAGRGPVLGHMVYGAALCPVSKEADCKNIGFVDSKKLDDKKRQVLFEKIKESDWLVWQAYSISPVTISNCMLRTSKYSLNAMSHDCAINMVRHYLNLGVNITQLYVDTVGVEEVYQSKLEKLFPAMKIVVCKKCDDIYPICSAASICAKVTRDEKIENWEFAEPGLEVKDRAWNSGYPGDAKCKDWLEENKVPVFGLPSIARFSWQTVKDLLQDSTKVEWREDDEDDATQMTLSFAPQAKRQKRFRYFNERQLSLVESF